jgi:hypothetical protein
MQFSKEEYDAIAAEEKRDPILGSVFRGPQGLFPLLNGYASFIPSFLDTLSHCFFIGNICPGSSL